MCAFLLLLPAPPFPRQDVQLIARKDDLAAWDPQPRAHAEALVRQESRAVFATGHPTAGTWPRTSVTCLVSVGI